MTTDVTSPASGEQATSTQLRWPARSLVGGIGGALLAGACCLPGAVALAVGASLGTAASLYRLQQFQLLFRVAGVALALGWSTWLLRRSRKTCSAREHQRNQSRVPLLAIGSFVAAFVVLNVLVIPWLERG